MEDIKINFSFFYRLQAILLGMGFLLTVVTKITSYSRFINVIEIQDVNFIDFLYIIQKDILIFLFFASILILQYKFAQSKKVKYTLIVPVFFSISSYYVYSFINLKWILESGTNITSDIIKEYANRTSDLTVLSAGYGTLWIIGIIFIPVFILLLQYLLRKTFFSFKSKLSYREKILIAFVLLIFLVTPYISGEGEHMRQLKLHPVLFELKESAVVQVSRDFFSARSLAYKTNAEMLTQKQEYPPNMLGEINKKPNIVFIILESTSFIYTPLSGDSDVAQMPFLSKIAHEGVTVPNTRTTFPHTTKAIFSILSGQYPVPSPYLVETEIDFPVIGIPEYLKEYGYTSAFFQSALGSFERRPSLVKNLGFDYFVTTHEIDPTQKIIGAFNMDEFTLIPSIIKWQQNQSSPFVMAILTSITHHPYILPLSTDVSYSRFYTQSDQEKKMAYKETLEYSDTFLEKIITSIEDTSTNPEGTLFVIVGDHGEAFGEHGQYVHSPVVYDEVLKIPLVFYWKDNFKKIKVPNGIYSSIDIFPTLLDTIGADKIPLTLDGVNVFSPDPIPRDVFFASWDNKMGLINEFGDKYIVNSNTKMVEKYNITKDPGETENIFPTTRTGEMSAITKLLLDWKADNLKGGFDVNLKLDTAIYGWVCTPTSYGKCIVNDVR